MSTPPDPQAIEWIFPERDRYAMGGNTVVDEFFGGRQRVSVASLVREAIQNSIDERSDRIPVEDPVAVHFHFTTLDNSASQRVIRKLFSQSFQAHVKKAESRRFAGKPELHDRLNEIASAFSAPLRVLMIEDLGTHGLCGPVDMPSAVDDTEIPNNLTHFMRKNGISGKTGRQLGSFGVGRHVFYAASRLGTFVVASTPESSWRAVETRRGLEPIIKPLLPARELAFGMSLQYEVQEWNQQGQGITHDNYLLMADEPDAASVTNVAIPWGVGDRDHRPGWLHDAFPLRRASQVSGLSIIIPWPLDGLTPEEITKLLVQEFAWPILNDRLVVKVDARQISSTTLRHIADDISPKHAEQVAFLSDAINHNVPDIVLSLDPHDDFVSTCEQIPEERIAEIAKAYSAGQVARFDADISFTADGTRQAGEVRCWLKLPAPGMKGRCIITRSAASDSPLILRRASDDRFIRDFNAVLQVGNDALGKLLRESEGPSHDEWKSESISRRCPDAAILLRAIGSLPKQINDLLVRVGTPVDRSIFSDLLPRPGGTTSNNAGGGGGRGTGRREVSPPSTDQDFEITECGSGKTLSYQIQPGKRVQLRNGDIVSILLLYDVASGTPAAAWTPDDYDLEPRFSELITLRGCSLVPESLDRFKFQVSVTQSKTLSIQIRASAFSGDKDLRIKAAKLSGGANE